MAKLPKENDSIANRERLLSEGHSKDCDKVFYSLSPDVACSCEMACPYYPGQCVCEHVGEAPDCPKRPA